MRTQMVAEKKWKLRDILTNEQIILAIRLKSRYGGDTPRYIRDNIVKPNLTVINETLGQKFDAMELAYLIDKILEEIGGVI